MRHLSLEVDNKTVIHICYKGNNSIQTFILKLNSTWIFQKFYSSNMYVYMESWKVTLARKYTVLGPSIGYSLKSILYLDYLKVTGQMHFFYYLKVAKITWYSTSYLLTFSFDPYYMMHLLTLIRENSYRRKLQRMSNAQQS